MGFRFVAFAVCAAAAPVLAEDLDPELVATVRHEQKAAVEAVAEGHDHRKSSEMSAEERREVIRQESEAQGTVLERHGVAAKDYARYSATLSREDLARANDAERRIEEKEKADREAAAQTKPEVVKVQRGFSNENPVELEATADAPPIVEHGIPVE